MQIAPWNFKVLQTYMALHAETCAIAKTSTVAGHHTMLAALLFSLVRGMKSGAGCSPFGNLLALPLVPLNCFLFKHWYRNRNCDCETARCYQSELLQVTVIVL